MSRFFRRLVCACIGCAPPKGLERYGVWWMCRRCGGGNVRMVQR